MGTKWERESREKCSAEPMDGMGCPIVIFSPILFVFGTFLAMVNNGEVPSLVAEASCFGYRSLVLFCAVPVLARSHFIPYFYICLVLVNVQYSRF